MGDEDSEGRPAGAGRQSNVRWERRFSNSLWHTDYKRLEDGRWLLVYMDDASRFIVGFGVFGEPTGRNALEVLQKAIDKYGRPAGILTDHDPQFYAKGSGGARSEFEEKMVELGIRHRLARARHRDTNNKLARFYQEVKRHLGSFEEESATRSVRGVREGDHIGGPFHTAGMTDPVSRLVEWHNGMWHSSLKDGMETPAEAYVRKMPPQDAADIETDESART